MHPAAEPSVIKQRDLCLRAGHTACATYVAAQALEHGEERDPRIEAGLWPTTKQSVLAFRPERAGVGPISIRARRTAGQGALAALIVGAFLVLAIARTTPAGPADAPPASFVVVGAAASQSAVAGAPGSSAAPSPRDTTPSATPATVPSPSAVAPSPTAGPRVSPSPAAPLAR
jgi:LysM repeat protein